MIADMRILTLCQITVGMLMMSIPHVNYTAWKGYCVGLILLFYYFLSQVAEKPRVFDIFLFSGEKDLLEIRLRTLKDVSIFLFRLEILSS